MKNYKCYTDGSYKSSRNQGGIGVVWIKNNELIRKYSKGFKNVTNNIMELLAIYVALRSIVKEIDSLEIISDSQYAIGCISNNSWNPKKNKELISKIKKQLIETQQLVKSPIKFTHVYGHQASSNTDAYYNNICDKIACEAAEYEIC